MKLESLFGGWEEFTVINKHVISREGSPEELCGKRNIRSGQAVDLDVQENQIRVGDTLTVAEGPHEEGGKCNIERMIALNCSFTCKQEMRIQELLL